MTLSSPPNRDNLGSNPFLTKLYCKKQKKNKKTKKNIVHITKPFSFLVGFIAHQFYYLCYIFFALCRIQFLVQYLTIGGVIGALLNGMIADLIGRRGVRFFCRYLKAYSNLLKLKS